MKTKHCTITKISEWFLAHAVIKYIIIFFLLKTKFLFFFLYDYAFDYLMEFV